MYTAGESKESRVNVVEFREMRRNKQQLAQAECIEILKRNTAGVLAVSGDNGYPYAVPLSYVYHDGKLYFHCAKSGHKLDAIARCDRASFCVIDRDDVVPEAYTTHYASVIAFGRARVVSDEREMREAVELLAIKYSPDVDEGARTAEIEGAWPRLCIVRLYVEHMTGKEAIELVRARKGQA